jgi:hypothetical protein
MISNKLFILERVASRTIYHEEQLVRVGEMILQPFSMGGAIIQGNISLAAGRIY